jgi:hypothetical protein
MAKPDRPRVPLKRLILVFYRRISEGRDGAQGRHLIYVHDGLSSSAKAFDY